MIIQGANEPVIIKFDSDIDIPSFKDIHVSLVNKHSKKIMKHWSKSDITIDGCFCICPLSQQDTIQFIIGECYIEVKWLDHTGYVCFAKPINDEVIYRGDRDIMK